MLHGLLLSLLGISLFASPAVEPMGNANGLDPDHVEAEFGVAGSFTIVTGYPDAVIPVSADLCIIDLPATFSFTGDLEGSFSSNILIEHYGGCGEPAPESFSTSGVWSGDVLGDEGSFGFNFGGHITAEHVATGILVIDDESGSGALEGLEGWMVLEGLAGVYGDYEGELELK